MIWLNWCIDYISGQSGHWSWSLISILTVLSILTVVYPKVVLTVVFIPTVVYILTVVSSLSDYSPQHSPHSYFHVILSCCTSKMLCICQYAWKKWFNNKPTYYLKAVCKPATTRREETIAILPSVVYLWRNQRRNNANDSFGKGFHMLKDHVLNRLMTGRCPSKSLLLKRRLLQNKKVTHRQSDRQTDKVTTVTLSRMRAEG